MQLDTFVTSSVMLEVISNLTQLQQFTFNFDQRVAGVVGGADVESGWRGPNPLSMSFGRHSDLGPYLTDFVGWNRLICRQGSKRGMMRILNNLITGFGLYAYQKWARCGEGFAEFSTENLASP